MHEEVLPLGPLTALGAEAIGEPGQRMFRVRAQTSEVAASLWLEKEQLQALAVAIEQLLAQLPGPGEPEGVAGSEVFREPASLDFKVGRLALGYIEDSNLVALLVHSLDADAEGPPSLICLASRLQLRALSHQIIEVCAAGRPRCPLCGEPMDPEGHHCVRLN